MYQEIRLVSLDQSKTRKMVNKGNYHLPFLCLFYMSFKNKALETTDIVTAIIYSLIIE